MKFRKLKRWEHDRTKALYETVFSEDKGAFADYYYTWKTRDNTIYAAEDENGIHAMVHLNPFEVSVYGKVQMLHYIVAVATEKQYRHRGLMRNLLNLAMREMAENGEPFTFLMPASEAIYLPFGFRFVSWQRQGILRAGSEKDLNDQNKEGGQKVKCGAFQAEQKTKEKMDQTECGMVLGMPGTEESALRKGQRTSEIKWPCIREISGSGSGEKEQKKPGEEHGVKNETRTAWGSGEICTECRPVRPREDSQNQRESAVREIRTECRPVRSEEYQALADLANETLAEQADIFIWRNCAYYERLVQEQRCQGGDVMVVLADGKIVGTFCTAKEEQECTFELREIIAIKEFQDLVFAALQGFADKNGDCKVYGCPDSLPLAQEERVPLMMARPISREKQGLQEERVPFMIARPLSCGEDSQEEYGSFLMAGQMLWDSGNSGVEKLEMDASQPFSVAKAAPGESVGKKFAAIKAAELPEAVIFINEVV